MREKLDLVEEKLESFSKNEKIALAVFIPLSVFTLFYFLYISDALNQQATIKKSLAKVNKNLHKYSQKVVLHKMQMLQQNVLHAKSAIVNNEQKLTFLKTQLTKKNFLLLSQKDFTNFLNDMLSKSIENHFLIDEMKISENDADFIGKIRYKKTVYVSGFAEFLNSLKFIRGVEENSMLIEIKNLKFELKDALPYVTFQINFYGTK